MNKELYEKLVDLYAGRELPAELESQMELAAAQDPSLSAEMSSLRTTVDALKSSEELEGVEESYQRVLLKLYTRAAEIEPQPEPAHFQYRLPLQA